MRIRSTLAVLIALVLGTATTARVQRFPFERTFDVRGVSTLDVSTMRGRIEVVAGAPGRIVVTGAATVRVAWDVPSSAVELAHGVADHPTCACEHRAARSMRRSPGAEVWMCRQGRAPSPFTARAAA